MSSIFSKILAARDVINQGEALSKPETWANGAAATGAIVLLLQAVATFVPSLENVDAPTLNAIAKGVFAVWTVVSMFVHTGSSPAAGLPPKRRPK